MGLLGHQGVKLEPSGSPLAVSHVAVAPVIIVMASGHKISPPTCATLHHELLSSTVKAASQAWLLSDNKDLKTITTEFAAVARFPSTLIFWCHGFQVMRGSPGRAGLRFRH